MNLQVAIGIGLVMGLGLGLAASATDSPLLMAIAESAAPFGTGFVNLIRMVVVPLVATTLFSGVAGLGNIRKLGKMGGLTFLFFWITTLASISIGMLTMTALLPLAPVDIAASAIGSIDLASTGITVPETLPGPVEFLLNLIPANPVEAAAEGALLPLIVFVGLLAAATGTLSLDDRNKLIDIADTLTKALVKLVHWILLVAPLGIFALAAPITARTGWSMLQSLGVFVIAVLLGLTLFIGLVYLPAVKIFGGIGPLKFLKACTTPQAIAFSTTSSAATLPAMLEAAEEELGVSQRIASLVLSLGASLGRAGSALFQGTGIVFLAALYDVPIGPGVIVAVILATFLVSLTVAGVPAASVVTMAPALNTLGVPIEGLAVLLGIDRIPDMARTATNVTGTIAASVIVEKQLGENQPG